MNSFFKKIDHQIDRRPIEWDIMRVRSGITTLDDKMNRPPGGCRPRKKRF